MSFESLEPFEPSLLQNLRAEFGDSVSYVASINEITLEISKETLLESCAILKQDSRFQFEMLMDLCGVDYLDYGISEWETTEASFTGFSRGNEEGKVREIPWTKPRFAVVYHLLSLTHNHRLRVRSFVEEEAPIIPSVIECWNSASWYEREVFDLFGILFDGHPDLRRILTDYGFVGHPFRKDFPLIGTVEMRYSAKDRRVIYQPVSITPRTLVPKTIRDDNRYLEPTLETRDR